MYTFVSLMDCVNAQGPACLVAAEIWPLWAIALVAAGTGWWTTRQQKEDVRALFARLTLPGLTMVLAGIAGVASILLVDFKAATGIEEDATAEALFAASSLLLGLGLVVVAGRAGLLRGALILIVIAVAAVGAFFASNPDAPLGVMTDPMVETMWVAAITAFGSGLMLLAVAVAVGLGVLSARASRRTGS